MRTLRLIKRSLGVLCPLILMGVNSLGYLPGQDSGQRESKDSRPNNKTDSKGGSTAPEPIAPQPAQWKIHLTGSGGDLGVVEQHYEIVRVDARRDATFSQIGENGKVEKKTVKLSEESIARLWQVMSDQDALHLPDFSGKKSKDSPVYLIKLELGDKTHALRIENYNQSPRHLKLILAIQECFKQGVNP